MDLNCEKKIVNNFINNRVKDRILYELSSDKKRTRAIARLCHNYNDIFINKYMVEIPKPNSDYLEIMNLLLSKGATKDCYAISFSSDIDGKYLPLKDALKEAVGLGMPSVISCNQNKLLYFESEQEFGAPPRFLLIRD